jgi:drug/metabolite transporter (DMT)-like permease
MLSGTLITLLGAGLWGLNAVVSKYLMAYGIDTMWMVNFRMIMSGFVLLIFALIRNRNGFFDIWKDRKSVIRLLVISIFAFGLCQPTYYISIDYSNAGIASAIQQTAPVFVLIYVIIKERRKPFPAELGALALVIAGSFLISTHGDFRALAVHPLALVSGLISALCCALYITLPADLKPLPVYSVVHLLPVINPHDIFMQIPEVCLLVHLSEKASFADPDGI